MRKFRFKPRNELAKPPAIITLPNIHGALSGRVKWELYDPETDQVVQSGEQSNLILNQGLDLIGVSSDANSWRSFFCVGEGISAPAVTQTALDTERARSNSNGGFTDVTAYAYDAGTKKYTATLTINRVITFTAGQSFVLTEFGFAAASSGSLSIRELFRDGSNNPTTITDTAGKQLRMTHTLTITLTGDWTQAASVTITGVGTVSGIGSFFSRSSTLANLFTIVFWPNNQALMQLFSAISALPTHGGSSSLSFTVTTASGSNTLSTYVNGSYSRKKTRVFPTSTGNGTVLGICVLDTNSADAAYLLRLDSGFTKTSSQQLTIEFTVSWGRAA